MPCYYPQQIKAKNGEQKKIGDLGLMRPCGKCHGCKIEKANEWAVRITHESQLYTENSFITLTYNKENLPIDRSRIRDKKILNSLLKRDLVNFIKKLRRNLEPKSIRHYSCGEYGDRRGRPHYHICLFNHDFPDKEKIHQPNYSVFNNRYKKNNQHPLYTSKTLEKIWGKGFVTIGELEFQSAAYVARYVTKKISGKPAPEHYSGKTPEFALMSRGKEKGGIGKPWLEKYFTDVYPKDFTTINGVKHRPPRYYDYIIEKTHPDLYAEIKERRKKNHKTVQMDRQSQLALHKKIVTKTLKRSN